ncbi:hypothetical protein JI739_03395 [Ramlibacter sp. AW1]|uniref:Transmembrane protein n=1 Tax=Ramlibacter aurantiacus TaxID=2801330 RepID=A0A936ZKH9_9BURK|nr:hypothetical protein [Ramlibacter aurantiacus]MBL0419386.1 hypothetical protein [Ramlibacter aurantiacus]
MYLVIIGWLYVTLMMAVAEATSPAGSLLGAFITLVFYGLLPAALLAYILGTPGRKRARRAREAEEEAKARADAASLEPDAGGDAPADAVPPVRKEP